MSILYIIITYKYYNVRIVSRRIAAPEIDPPADVQITVTRNNYVYTFNSRVPGGRRCGAQNVHMMVKW